MVTHHPAEKHAETFAGGMGVLGYHNADAVLAEKGTDGGQSVDTRVCVPFYILPHGAMLQEQVPVGLKELVHAFHGE